VLGIEELRGVKQKSEYRQVIDKYLPAGVVAGS